MSDPLRSRRLIWWATLGLGVAVLAIMVGSRCLSGERAARKRLVLWDSIWFQPGHFSPDGRTLIGYDGGSAFRTWDTFTGAELKTLALSTLRYAIMMPDGRLLGVDGLLGDGAETVKVLEPDTGRQQVTPLSWRLLLPVPHDLVFSPAGDLAAVPGEAEVVVWDTVTWQKRATIVYPNKAVSPGRWAFSSDGLTLAVSYDAATVIWWDLSTGKAKAQFDKHGPRDFFPQAFSLDLQTVVADHFPPDACICGGHQEDVLLWHLGSGERTIIAPRLGPRGDISRIDGPPFSPDGQTIALRLSSVDEPLFPPPIVARLLGVRVAKIETFQVTLYDVPSGRLRAILPGCCDGMFSPDGMTFAGVTREGIQLWDLPER
jgi:WD40 repeat protein